MSYFDTLKETLAALEGEAKDLRDRLKYKSVSAIHRQLETVQKSIEYTKVKIKKAGFSLEGAKKRMEAALATTMGPEDIIKNRKTDQIFRVVSVTDGVRVNAKTKSGWSKVTKIIAPADLDDYSIEKD